MPYALPKQRGLRRESNISGQPSVNQGTTLTASGTSHVLGTKSVIFASTAFETDWVHIRYFGSLSPATDTDQLSNIYVGADTAEQLLIPNLLTGWAGADNAGDQHRQYIFPLRIPAGSRITADLQALIVSDTVVVAIDLYGGAEGMHWTGTRVEAVGADTANSDGTPVTPGTSSEGTLTSIGTTVHDWGWVQPQIGGSADTTMPGGCMALDLASGASTPIPGLDEFYFGTTTSEGASNPGMYVPGRFCFIPAGTTLHARLQTAGTTAEATDTVVYGVY